MGKIVTKVVIDLALSLVPDLLICWAYAKLVDGEWREFFTAYVVLLALSIFLWVKSAAWAWVLFWIYGKRSMASSLEETFGQAKFPAPLKSDEDVYDYLNNIADDESVDCGVRVKAAAQFGTLQGMKAAGEHGAFIRLLLASKQALNKYARYAPQRALNSLE